MTEPTKAGEGLAVVKKPHVSPSQLDSYTRCGEAYRRRYVEREIIPPAFSMTKGSSVHTGQEHDFRQKIETKVNLPKNEVVELVAASFDGRIKAEGVLLTEAEESIGKAIVTGKAKDSTIRMAQKLSEAVGPKYQPLAVEVPFRIVLPGPRDLVGFIDLELENGFQDLKTGAKAKSQSDIDGDVQFTTYAAAYQNLRGKPPEEIVIDNIIDRVSPKTSKVTTEHIALKTLRGPADFKALANRINTIVAGITAGHFMPATPGAWWCSPKSCGYWRTCPMVNSERRAAGEAADEA